MKVKLDENLPAAVESALARDGHDVATVVGERLGGRDDDAVASAARGEERVLITFDVDFADERRYPPGSHPGIVVRRLRSQERDAVVGVVERLLASQDVEGFAGALVIVTESTVRVRRPGS